MRTLFFIDFKDNQTAFENHEDEFHFQLVYQLCPGKNFVIIIEMYKIVLWIEKYLFKIYRGRYHEQKSGR